MPTFDNAVAPQFLMSLAASEFVSLTDSNRTASVESINEKPCKALAGIGSPQRFFKQLTQMGITLDDELALPDHHAFSEKAGICPFQPLFHQISSIYLMLN